MTESELSAAVVKQFNMGGAVTLSPDVSLLSYEELINSKTLEMHWLREKDSLLCAFHKVADGYKTHVYLDGVFHGTVDTHNYFVEKLIQHLKERMQDPLCVIENYDADGKLTHKEVEH